jgi:hypothetical protein
MTKAIPITNEPTAPRRSRALPFTQAGVVRAMNAVEAAGRVVLGIKPDGTVIVGYRPIETASFVSESPQKPPESSTRRFGDRLLGDQSPKRPGDYFSGDKSGPASIWDDKRPEGPDALAASLDRYMRGEITFDQLPPGRYPNGMRVYADGEWEAIVRNRPLNKRELASLKAYAEADGLPNFRNNGPDTNERLEIRGLIEKSVVPPEGRIAHYRITEAGKAECLRLTNKIPEAQP